MPDNGYPQLQRRHFDFIADSIATLTSVSDFQKRNIAMELCFRLRQTNSRFNRDRFMARAVPTPTPDVTPDVTPGPPPLCRDCGRQSETTPATHIHRYANNSNVEFYCGRHCGSCCEPINSEVR